MNAYAFLLGARGLAASFGSAQANTRSAHAAQAGPAYFWSIAWVPHDSVPRSNARHGTRGVHDFAGSPGFAVARIRIQDIAGARREAQAHSSRHVHGFLFAFQPDEQRSKAAGLPVARAPIVATTQLPAGAPCAKVAGRAIGRHRSVFTTISGSTRPRRYTGWLYFQGFPMGHGKAGFFCLTTLGSLVVAVPRWAEGFRSEERRVGKECR